MKPRLLDLFCGAGGCSVGYHRAGFDVIGVDIVPQPNYPFEFIQCDALEFVREHVAWDVDHGFDVIHASPPCPAYSFASHYHGTQANHPDMIGPTRELLDRAGVPHVIENVVGAPLRRDLMLCGEMSR